MAFSAAAFSFWTRQVVMPVSNPKAADEVRWSQKHPPPVGVKRTNLLVTFCSFSSHPKDLTGTVGFKKWSASSKGLLSYFRCRRTESSPKCRSLTRASNDG